VFEIVRLSVIISRGTPALRIETNIDYRI